MIKPRRCWLVLPLILLLISCADPKNEDTGNNIPLLPGKWIQMNPNPSPSARILHAMVYDTDQQQVILFGGKDESGLLNDTWTYNPSTNIWGKQNTLEAPASRLGHVMVYDPNSRRVILFGGTTTSGLNNETWAFDSASNTWIHLQLSNSPARRDSTAAVYIPMTQQMLLFGGQADTGLNDETWVFDLLNNTWENIPFTKSPAPRLGHTMAYDPFNFQAILFGGETAAGRSNETWAYDIFTRTWTSLSPSLSPSPRSKHAMVYDTFSQRVFLFGGFSTGSSLPSGETWVFDVVAKRWSQLNPFPFPHVRFLHGMVYNPHGVQVLLFAGGGEGCGDSNCFVQSGFLSDTWRHQPD
jgi:hypothetical protein